MPKRVLLTAALPYANGPIHLGHLVEYTQADIWARFQRLIGNDCRYFCADDTHGTGTMIRARREGRSEEALIEEMSEAHQRDLADFQIRFDHFGSTHSEANRALCADVWSALRAEGLVVERDVTQLYDPEAEMFLADRFVKGTCPKCEAKDQYGDHCEKCGSTYSPGELIEPYSTVSGAVPETRTAPHLFVQIHQLQDFLAEWVAAEGHLQDEVRRYLESFFLGKPLKDWDISRPAPYFGFEIPDAPGQYWYVWFDAPIGYIAATKEWCDATGASFDDWWRAPDTRIVHVIGKDIVYFHCLFWPAMLKTAGYTLPDRVQIHGMLTVDGEKMSKSRGTFVMARTYLDHLDPAYLRYFYASQLTSRIDDFDLGLEAFVNKVNSDLVGKLVNLASRTAKFVKDTGLSDAYPDDGGLFERAAAEGDAIREAYEAFDFAKAMRRIMALADRANEYVEAQAPWTLRKDPARQEALQDVCTAALNLFRQLVIYVAPVLPRLAEDVGALLHRPIEHWDEARTPLVGTPVAPFRHLMKRVELAQVERMIEESVVSEESAPATPAPEDQDGLDEPIAPECTFEDFTNVDLRVARVEKAEHVEGADKLLRLTLSLGPGGTKTVFAGIKSAYTPEELGGRLVVCVANLKPRKMKFGVSEGMVVAAGPGGDAIHLLAPDEGAVPGQRVH